jgi:hypothetical protein
MNDPRDAPRRTRRTKVVDIAPSGGEHWDFHTRLTDEAWGGDFGGPDRVVIHDIVARGVLSGDDLVLTALELEPLFLPYAQCPRVEAAVAALVGEPLRSGWRRAVLDKLGGSRGCTHVMTLLLGLSEAATQIIFLQMNAVTEYSAGSRSDGSWMTTGLNIAPGLADVCHALTSDGVVLSPIIKRRSSTVNNTVDSDGAAR